MNRCVGATTILTIMVMCSSVAFSQLIPADATESVKITSARDVILVLAPGMGYEQLNLLKAIGENEGKPTILDGFRKQIKMNTSIKNSLIPDTNGGASTIATGQKCPAGSLSVTSNGQPITTILEKAADSGRSIGLITLGNLTYGAITPFAVHGTANATDLKTRAQQLFESHIQFLVGGDKKVFENAKTKEDVPLLEAMKKEGYSIIDGSRKDLHLAKGPKIAGFFSHKYRIDHQHNYMEPNLSPDISEALAALSPNPMGFFLVIEVPFIDEACRMGDISGLGSELMQLDALATIGLRYTNKNPDTLLVVASPHETGNFMVLDDFLPTYLAKREKIKCSATYADMKLGKVDSVMHIMQVFTDTVGLSALERYEVENMGELPQGPERTKAIAKILTHHLAGAQFLQDTPSGRSVPCLVNGFGARRWPDEIENSDLAGLLEQAMGLQ